MKQFIVSGLVPWLLLAGASTLWAQETPTRTKDQQVGNPAKVEASATTPAERYRDVLKAYQKAQQEFSAEYGKAKTDAERSKVIQAKYPDRDSYAEKMLKIADDAPKDPVAVEALVWIAMNSSGPRAEKSMKVLLADHVQDPKIASLCSRMVYDNSPQSETFLREVLARNPGHEAKGQACLALGQKLKMAAEQAGTKEKTEAMTKEAETLLERVTREFAEVKHGRGSLGDAAKNVLNELRNLGIGKVAPEIAGEDIDGKTMKLTDFRGKVVVLDFWGDW
jgi:hypothetical protein